MHDLDTIIALNARAVDRCDHCGRTRQALEARGSFLARYDALGLLCRDCRCDLAEARGERWDGTPAGEQLDPAVVAYRAERRRQEVA